MAMAMAILPRKASSHTVLSSHRFLILACLAALTLSFLAYSTALFDSIDLAALAHSTLDSDNALDDIYNDTLGFEKIFILSLPERLDRRDGLVVAAAVSNISVDFIDSVRRDSIPDKVLPVGHRQDLKDGEVGAWRTHLNTYSHIIQHDISSALIAEDDIDWDIRLKPLLHGFAIAANALLALPATHNHEMDISLPKLYQEPLFSNSPYGDDWVSGPVPCCFR